MKRKLFCNHSLRYMRSNVGASPRKYQLFDGGELIGMVFRHRTGDVRCVALDPESSLVEPDGVKKFSGGHEEWVYKL